MRTLSRLLVVLLVLLVLLGVPLLAAPDTPPPTALRVAVAGGFSAAANARAVLSSLAAGTPDLALALGDLSYGPTG